MTKPVGVMITGFAQFQSFLSWKFFVPDLSVFQKTRAATSGLARLLRTWSRWSDSSATGDEHRRPSADERLRHGRRLQVWSCPSYSLDFTIANQGRRSDLTLIAARDAPSFVHPKALNLSSAAWKMIFGRGRCAQRKPWTPTEVAWVKGELQDLFANGSR